MTAKERMIQALRKLPDDASIEDGGLTNVSDS